MEWTEEQEASAKKKVLENSQPLPSEKQGLNWFSDIVERLINADCFLAYRFHNKSSMKISVSSKS